MRLAFAVISFLSCAHAASCALAQEGSPTSVAVPMVSPAQAAMEVLASEGFAGSVLVACGETPLFAGDFGLRGAEGRAPSYWIASISKQFTAAAILRLSERGALSLSDSLSRFFPEAPPDKADITLFQLLTHQSGLPQGYAADGVQDRDAAAAAILATPLAQAPGGGFLYSNDNYTLLALVTELATGEPFETFVAREVFAPAGLRDFGFWPDDSDAFTPHLIAPRDAGRRIANWGFRGPTGMRMSVDDLHRWALALNGDAVLNAESRRLLFGPHVSASNGEQVGFNWFWAQTQGRSWLSTRGSESYGANAVLYLDPASPLIIIAATHAGPRDGQGWSRRARDALMSVFASGDTAPCAAAP